MRSKGAFFNDDDEDDDENPFAQADSQAEVSGS